MQCKTPLAGHWEPVGSWVQGENNLETYSANNSQIKDKKKQEDVNKYHEILFGKQQSDTT